jgi:hypothetical protein
VARAVADSLALAEEVLSVMRGSGVRG